MPESVPRDVLLSTACTILAAVSYWLHPDALGQFVMHLCFFLWTTDFLVIGIVALLDERPSEG